MPDIDDERNAHPAERQNKAAVEQAVCGLNALLVQEDRTHRRVGYKNSVARFHSLKMSRCNELRHELHARTYRPEKGVVHEVFEPKYRLTVSAKYKDRVPQSSFIINYFYKVVIPNLTKSNCACIKGRGTDYAREMLVRILREADPDHYCLKADMKSYFASIDHEKLYKELEAFIKDEWAQWFFRLTVENSERGLDLGSEVYQLSATSFLNRLDHLLDHGTYVRYQDDLLFVGTKEECEAALETIKAEADRLSLKVHEKKTFIQPISRPVHFLGFSFLRKETGRITTKRLRDRVRHERRKLRRMKQKGVPLERVKAHYDCVRACMKKGTRSDLIKLDRYYNDLFGGKENACDQKGQHRP